MTDRTITNAGDLSALGARVTAHRVALGLTAKTLAARLGVSASGLRNVERGSHEPGARLLVALAEALGTSLDTLWYGPEAVGHPGQWRQRHADAMRVLGQIRALLPPVERPTPLRKWVPAGDDPDEPRTVRLVRVRKARGLSQKALGELAGVDFATIRSFEQGRGGLNADTLAKLAAALGVPMDYLWLGEGVEQDAARAGGVAS